MKKESRKKEKCLNCDSSIDLAYNYCPFCGQENTDYRVSIGELIVEFLGGYFNFDSRLGRSIVPFLCKPGFLTNEFNKGRRVKYVHPIRFYFIISFLFFIVFFSQVADNSTEGANKQASQQEEKNITIDRKDDNVGFFAEKDSSTVKNRKKTHTTADSISKPIRLTAFGVDYYVDYAKLETWLQNPKMTPDALLDSLKASEKNFLNRRLARQLLKLKGDPQQFYKAIRENIPNALFLLLPVFALILKVFYIRSQKLFIEHLIFSFHLHTFVFFVFLFPILFEWWWNIDIWNISLFILTVYSFFMLKNVYRQTYRKTLLKFFGILTVYGVAILFASLCEIIFSLLFF
ncbi:MAG: DUF3667 domain-containing protein [Flammeovirgaceae bacterium]|nr:DUF3667 domain-containing protein [Flammeovirgaceae bacterium]